MIFNGIWDIYWRNEGWNELIFKIPQNPNHSGICALIFFQDLGADFNKTTPKFHCK